MENVLIKVLRASLFVVNLFSYISLVCFPPLSLVWYLSVSALWFDFDFEV